MPVSLPLNKMSRTDKLRAMDALWADLSQKDTDIKSPSWHRDELRKSERAVKSGKAKFSDWDEAKARIRQRTAKAR
jgi:hypothetical protein